MHKADVLEYGDTKNMEVCKRQALLRRATSRTRQSCRSFPGRTFRTLTSAPQFSSRRFRLIRPPRFRSVDLVGKLRGLPKQALLLLKNCRCSRRRHQNVVRNSNTPTLHSFGSTQPPYPSTYLPVFPGVGPTYRICSHPISNNALDGSTLFALLGEPQCVPGEQTSAFGEIDRLVFISTKTCLYTPRGQTRRPQNNRGCRYVLLPPCGMVRSNSIASQPTARLAVSTIGTWAKTCG